MTWLLDDVAQYLETASTAYFTVGVDLTKGFMPDNPATVTTVYETGGFSSIHYFSTGAATRVFERPGVMIHSRSTSYATARATAFEAWRLLDGIHDRGLPTTTGTLYQSIDAVQSPFEMGRDRNDRFVFSVNFTVVKSTDSP